MDVDGRLALTGVPDDGRREETVRPGVGVEQTTELAPCGVSTIAWLCGQQQQEPEVITRWMLDLVNEHVDHLRRPKELVLEVDEVLGRAQGSQVGIQDGELSARREAIGALRHGADDLYLHVAVDYRLDRFGQCLPGNLAPPVCEMPFDVNNRRPTQAHSSVVPSQRFAGVVVGVVIPVTLQCREIDASHEGKRAVDNDDFLVVTMQCAPTVVEFAPHATVSDELRPRLFDHPARGRENRHRGTGPQQQPDWYPLGRFCQQVTQGFRVASARHLEVGAGVPVGDVDRVLGTPDLLLYFRQSRRAVDEHLDTVTDTHRCPRRPPALATRRIDRLPPTETLKPPAMMGPQHSLKPVTNAVVPLVKPATVVSHHPSAISLRDLAFVTSPGPLEKRFTRHLRRYANLRRRSIGIRSKFAANRPPASSNSHAGLSLPHGVSVHNHFRTGYALLGVDGVVVTVSGTRPSGGRSSAHTW